jgi:MSHA type pilus biogenesis protein MshL
MERKYQNTIKKASKCMLLSSVCTLLLSCSWIKGNDGNRVKDLIEPTLNMTREEFKKGMLPPEKKDKSKKESEPSIPEASEILVTPPPPEVLPDKLVSLAVTEDVPLKDVLIELSRLADIDMEIDPGITGGIILRVKDKPFNEVIERVVNLGNLRYYVKNGVMRVERDTPYLVNYKVDFLNLTRETSGTSTVDTTGLGSGSDTTSSSGSGSSSSSTSSSSSSSSSSGGSSGSTSTTTSSTKGDVWDGVTKSIQNILNYNQGSNMGSGNGGVTNSQQTASSSSSASGTANASDNVLQMNRPAGIISIIATQKQHKAIDDYLDKVEEQVSSQVLIEAKVVEVTLNDEYKSGIDWGTIKDQGLGLKLAGNFLGGIDSAADFFTISGGADSNRSLKTAVSLTEAFGVTRTISSPRLNAMNNQKAILSFTDNTVYFKLNVTEETDGTGATAVTSAKVTSDVKTVPVGVILALQPSINMETSEITMHINPTLSKITRFESDPGVAIILSRQTSTTPITAQSNIPVIEKRELDSILKIKSGDIMVIGGLMKNDVASTDKGVPFVNRTPILGNLFKSKEQTTSTVETIIFIKATIVPKIGKKVSPEDRHIYKTFMKDDMHPLAF